MSKAQPKNLKKFSIVTVSLLMLLLAACQPVQPPANGSSVGTIVAQTLEALTVTAPTTVPTDKQTVTYDNIAFSIPLELDTSAIPSATTDVEFPYINPSNGPMPEHVVFQFAKYPVPGDAKIMVFKASEYADYGEPLQQAFAALLAGQDTAQPLPEALVQGEFYAQGQPVHFKNGHGVRYLTQVLTNFAPVTNEDLFYYYQGLTTDGTYFLSAIFHVNAAFLVANSSPDSVTPPDGIPFGDGSNLDFPTYLNAVTRKLNDTPAESYTPSLLTLDKMIESLQITAP